MKRKVIIVRTAVIVCAMILSAALLAACDDSAAGKVNDAQGKDAQRNGGGTSSVEVSPDSGDLDAETGGLAGEGSGEAVRDETAGIADAPNAQTTPEPSDDDILVVGEKMFVGQMNDIYLNPDDYIGRILRYEGFFSWYDNEATGQRYDMVVRNGPGCCGYDSLVGFEVDWDGKTPAKNDWCSVRGAIDTYEEDGFDYIIIRADVLEVLPNRGNDTVTQ
jgi:predicted small secreted protein